MNQPWTIVSAVGGAAGVGVMLIAHIVTYAYQRGRTDHRLDALEKSTHAAGEVHVVLSALSATVAALKESVTRLDRALERINSRVFEEREP